MATLLLSAGDASGELHAADFAATFQKRNPGTRLLGVGAESMRKAGVEIVADQRDLAVGGLLELAGGAAGVLRAWRAVGRALARERPDLVVLVDSAGFNLPLARRIRRRFGVPVLYYVAPQVWAWRSGRIRKIARRVDRVAVIFPFEKQVYEGTGVAVDFVGHPLVDALPEALGVDARDAARARIGVPEGEGPLVTLLPGSRRNEIAAHLPLQLETAARLADSGRVGRFLLAVAPSLDERVRARLRDACRARVEAGLCLQLLEGGARDAIAAADVVLAKPGTVTMECALMGRPLVVMGRAHPVTAWIARRAVRVSSLTMPNLIAGAPIVPEFLQQDALPERLAEAVVGLLEGPDRDTQLLRLAEIRTALGPPGAAERACRIAEEMLASAGS